MRPANILLTAGQSYFVKFSVATPINGSIRYQALLLNTPSPIAFGFPAIDSADGGATWLTPVIPNEIGLAVSVPEPSSLALGAIAAVGIGLRLRSMRRGHSRSADVCKPR